MTRAAIPIMRQQKSGYILQISSVGGRFSTPGGAAYHAAKWAIGGSITRFLISGKRSRPGFRVRLLNYWRRDRV
jgi:NADP-dependent 3-hydroxy acid dehydrogenase YdfG